MVKAFVVLTEDYQKVTDDPTEAANLINTLQEFVKKKTAPYKYPRKIEFVNALPKTVSGKIRRAHLRKEEKLKRI